MNNPTDPGTPPPQHPQQQPGYQPGSGYGSGPAQPGPGYSPDPGYGSGPGGAPSAGPAGTNTMAVLAIVFAFLVAPVGIVFGAIGRSQTRRTGQHGKGLATAGLVLGIVFTLIGVGAIAIGVVAAKSVTPSVAQGDVESQIGDQLQISNGHRPQSVACSHGLAAKVGTAIGCTVTDEGKTIPMTATVTSVEGNTAHFSIAAVQPALTPTAPVAVPAPAATGAPAPAPRGSANVVACNLFDLGALNASTGLSWTKAAGANTSECSVTASNGNVIAVNLVPTGGSTTGALSGAKSACDVGSFLPQNVADGGYTCTISGVSSGGAVFAADATLVAASAVTFNGATPERVQASLLNLLRSFTA